MDFQAGQSLIKPGGSGFPHRVGLFGIGLDTYWPQFSGLKERLEGYIGVVESRLARLDIEVVNLGLIDSPEKAFDAGHAFRQADVDLTFLHVTTYALSSTVAYYHSATGTTFATTCYIGLAVVSGSTPSTPRSLAM